MNPITGLHPFAPLLHEVASWREQRRQARHTAILDNLPAYLLSDIGLLDRSGQEVETRAALLDALRKR